MEESINKVVWIAVAIGIIAGIYGALKIFFPKLMDSITTNIQKFTDKAFDSMMPGNDSGK